MWTRDSVFIDLLQMEHFLPPCRVHTSNFQFWISFHSYVDPWFSRYCSRYCDHLWWLCLTDEEEDRCYCWWWFSFNLLDHVQRLSSAKAHWAHHAHKRSQHHHRRLAAIRSNDNWLELLHELKNGNWTVFKYDKMRPAVFRPRPWLKLHPASSEGEKWRNRHRLIDTSGG